MQEGEIHVLQTNEGWIVQPIVEQGETVFDTQHDAILAAAQQAQQSKQEVVVHDGDGSTKIIDPETSIDEM
jgi:hypothetical protein